MIEIESDIQEAILDRLTSDATLGNLVEAIWYEEAPEDQAYPYVVFDLASAVVDTPNDGFKHDAFLVTIAVGVYTTRRTTPHATVRQINKRVFGDSNPGTQAAPTFGLHRWTPTLVGSEFEVGHMLVTTYSKQFDDEARASIYEFELEVWRDDNQ